MLVPSGDGGRGSVSDNYRVNLVYEEVEHLGIECLVHQRRGLSGEDRFVPST